MSLCQSSSPKLKSGQTFSQFTARNGKTIVLRSFRWEDLDSSLDFINTIVAEREEDPNLGILIDKKHTRESESEWLSHVLVEMEKGNMISVVAESALDGKIVGTAIINRGAFSDIRLHGTLGMSISKGYRNLGIGLHIMKTLLAESREAGLKTLELEVFANNPRAIHLYGKVGFKEVGRIPMKIHGNGRYIDGVIMAIEL